MGEGCLAGGSRAGDAPGRKCPRAEQNRQRPIDVSEVTGNVRPVLQVAPLARVRCRFHTLRRPNSC